MLQSLPNIMDIQQDCPYQWESANTELKYHAGYF